MAIAHICLDCGWDLARLRPRRDPHYGLPIVRCPRCDTVSVRRLHPLTAAWKTIRRVDWSLTVLFVQLILAAAFTAATMISVLSLGVAAWTIVNGNVGNDILWFILVPLFIVAPLTGIWLSMGFSHIRAWKVWMGWCAWIMAALVLSAAITAVGSDELLRNVSIVWNLDPMTKGLYGGLAAWVAGGPILIVMMACALIGVLPGRGLLWSLGRLRQAQWRVRRRMRRKALVTA